MHRCYGWELCVSFFYGSFRFTTPRNRGWRGEEEEVEKTKPNKHRVVVTPSSARTEGGRCKKRPQRKREIKRVHIWPNQRRGSESYGSCYIGAAVRSLLKCLSRELTHWRPDSVSHSFHLWPGWFPQLVKRQNEQRVKFHPSQTVNVTFYFLFNDIIKYGGFN